MCPRAPNVTMPPVHLPLLHATLCTTLIAPPCTQVSRKTTLVRSLRDMFGEAAWGVVPRCGHCVGAGTRWTRWQLGRRRGARRRRCGASWSGNAVQRGVNWVLGARCSFGVCRVECCRGSIEVSGMVPRCDRRAGLDGVGCGKARPGKFGCRHFDAVCSGGARRAGGKVHVEVWHVHGTLRVVGRGCLSPDQRVGLWVGPLA